MSQIVKEARSLFERRFGNAPTITVVAPGRVNLIGEHVDYNGGFVMPVAIDRHVAITARPNGGGVSRFMSGLQGSEFEFGTGDKLIPGDPKWGNYIKGVFAMHAERHREALPGVDAVVCADLPMGSGLSSSAALEVATATLVEALAGASMGDMEKALLCHRVENEFVGLPCGIMDQFASTLSRANHALLLDCLSREVVHVPVPREDIALIVAHSGVSHELTDGAYAERVKQCEEARAALGVDSLRHARISDLERVAADLPEVVHRRARHVIREIERTREAAEAANARRWQRFGELMYDSHESLRADYEVSCEELDQLVDIARAIGEEGGVHGARMTGGGFGGCTITMTRADRAEPVLEAMCAAWRQTTGQELVAFATPAVDGARQM